MRYYFRWSLSNFATTLICLVTLAVLNIIIIRDPNIGVVGCVVITSLIWLINITLALFTPLYVVVSRGEIVIRRAIGSLRIKNIESIEAIDQSRLKGSIRIFGVGGFFGSWGRFRGPQIGRYRLYATQFKNLFLIRTTTGERIVISCGLDKTALYTVLNNINYD